MSSNITKNFKAKSALRKEHGGDVKGPRFTHVAVLRASTDCTVYVSEKE